MLESLLLVGDGDDVDAIRRVEEAFGIEFFHRDCALFVTVGDLWWTLLRELQVDETSPEAEAAWPQMVWALGEETLSERQCLEVGLETRLIG